MKVYKYKVIDKTGVVLKGSLRAETKEDAMRALPLNDKILTFKDIGTAVSAPPIIAKTFKLHVLSREELISFMEQLSYMIETGVSNAKALSIMVGTATPKTKRVAKVMLDTVNKGKDLADAFTAAEEYLPVTDFINLVKVGVTSATVHTVLRDIAIQLKEQYTLFRKVRSAFVTPIITLVITLLCGYYALVFVVPPMMEQLNTLGDVETPMVTLIVSAFINFLAQWGTLLLFLLISGILIARYLIHKFIPIQWGRFKLKLPVIGGILRDTAFFYFYHNLKLMLKAEYSTTEAFKRSLDGVKNPFIHSQLLFANNLIREGKSLPVAMSHLSIVHPMELQAMEIGMSTSKTHELIGSVMVWLQESINMKIERMLKLLEPTLTIIMSAIVLVIALAIYLPTLSIINLA